MYSYLNNNEYVEIENCNKLTPSQIAIKIAKLLMNDDDEQMKITIRNNKMKKDYIYTVKKTYEPKYISQKNPDIYYTYDMIPYEAEKNDKFSHKHDDYYIIKNKKNKIKIIDENKDEMIVYEYVKNKIKSGKGRPKKDFVKNTDEKYKQTRYYDFIPNDTFKQSYKYEIV